MVHRTAPSVLHIALDGCDAGLMLDLAARGRCPNIAALLQDGAAVESVAPFGTFVGSSWMTISTGDDVGTHRYWNWMEVDPDTYALRHTTPREARSRPFWEQLSDAGCRVAVFDVPHAAVPASFNGVVVKEWGCHDRHDGTASFPPAVLDELDQVLGRHPVGCREHPSGDQAFAPCDYTLRSGFLRTTEEERALIDLLYQGIDVKHRASVMLMEREPWDVFTTVFGEAHCVGHQFWHLHDEHHPRHDPSARRLLGDPVEAVYTRLDAVVGDLVTRVPMDTTVYVQMNHGMGPHFDGDHLLDQLLLRIDDYLRGSFRPGSWSRVGRAVTRRTPSGLRGAMHRGVALSARLKSRVGPPVPSVRPWPRADRRFFSIPGNTSVGAVRFNVVGRESRGLVRRGADLSGLIDMLADALLEVIDVTTGRPLVRSVVRAEDVLDKHHDDRLPDVFVEWDRSSLVEQVWSPMTGTVAARYEHWRTGDHHDRGIFIARGPGIAPGRRPAPMALTDVAPTIAAAAGVELVGVDGRAHADLEPARRARVGPGGVSDEHRRRARPEAGPAGG
jgi:predicted AlkP superfamily phosphohydrolase/phosphomutase